MSLKSTDVRTLGNEAIAKKFKISLARVRDLVKKGAKHEKEHNTNQKKAEQVARDHIGERPDYYAMLDKADKADKNKLKEEIGTSAVRGLGYVTGDPGVNPVERYTTTNMMAYNDQNGNNLKYIKNKHYKYHNDKLGFKAFDPTKMDANKNFGNIAEEKLNELGEYDHNGGVNVVGDLTGNTRRVAKVEEKNDLKGACWKGYTAKGLKKKGNRMVPNCVPTEQVEASVSRYTERATYEENKYPTSTERGIYQEDWQSVNRKDKTDGLSQKAVDAYKRENPGSKLQTAVTEKNPKGKRASRRKSFCSRMGGMKKRLTSAKTANDPDSRINKALRRWNCEENFNKPDTRYAPGATGTTKTIYEETKMNNKEIIQEAFDNILENNLDDMRENFQAILQEKTIEKLEERKKEIASNYFAQ